MLKVRNFFNYEDVLSFVKSMKVEKIIEDKESNLVMYEVPEFTGNVVVGDWCVYDDVSKHIIISGDYKYIKYCFPKLLKTEDKNGQQISSFRQSMKVLFTDYNIAQNGLKKQIEIYSGKIAKYKKLMKPLWTNDKTSDQYAAYEEFATLLEEARANLKKVEIMIKDNKKENKINHVVFDKLSN